MKLTKPSQPHYMGAGIEPIDYIVEHGWFEHFAKACIIKYISRAGKKEGESALKDYEKILQYTKWLIEMEVGKGVACENLVWAEEAAPHCYHYATDQFECDGCCKYTPRDTT